MNFTRRPRGTWIDPLTDQHTMKTLLSLKPVITSVLFLTLVASMGTLGEFYTAKKSRAISERTLPALSHLALGMQYRGEAFLHLICAVDSSTEVEFEREAASVEISSNLGSDELQSYEDTIESDQNRTLYEDLMKERENYIKLRKEILTLRRTGLKEQATQRLTDGLLPIYQKYLSHGQKLVDYTAKEGVSRANDIHKIALWSQVFAVISSLLIFILGFLIGYTR